MKISELYAELGFKIEGADDLKAVANSLNNIKQSLVGIIRLMPQLGGLGKIRIGASGGSAAGATTSKVPPILTATSVNPLQPQNNGKSVAEKEGAKSLTTFVKQLAGFGSLAYLLKSLVNGFASMIRSSAAASFNLEKFTRQTGVTIAEMKHWEQIGAANAVSSEEIQENLKSLQQNAQHISMGMGGTNANRWGIDPLLALNNPAAIFRRFQQVTQGMTQAQAMAVAGQAGLSANIAQMLLREREHPTATQPGLDLTTDQLETNRKLGVAWAELKVVMSSLADKITSDVAPAFSKILEVVTRIAALWSTQDSLRKATGLPIIGPSLFLAGSVIPFLKPPTTGSATNKTENNISISIDGSGRPEETARATSIAINRMLSDAAYQRAQPYPQTQ